MVSLIGRRLRALPWIRRDLPVRLQLLALYQLLVGTYGIGEAAVIWILAALSAAEPLAAAPASWWIEYTSLKVCEIVTARLLYLRSPKARFYGMLANGVPIIRLFTEGTDEVIEIISPFVILAVFLSLWRELTQEKQDAMMAAREAASALKSPDSNHVSSRPGT